MAMCIWAWFLAGAALAADKPASLAEGVTVGPYTGWRDSLTMYADDMKFRVVIVPAIGGRIAHYSLKGENIIFENSASFGKTLANTKDGLWVGGYQCDLGPELRT